MPCAKCGGYHGQYTTTGLCSLCASKVEPQIFDVGQPFRDVSMGCKAPYEGVCSICGLAWSATEKCAHIGDALRRNCMPALLSGRMPWDDYFLTICQSVKLRSIDVDTQNGAVIANPQHRIVSTGYNAFPAGVDDAFWPNQRGQTVKVPHVSVPRGLNAMVDCSMQPPLTATGMKAHPSMIGMAGEPIKRVPFDHYDVDKYMPMTHAEMNAVVSAGQDLHGCCVYTLLFPCHECAKAIITSGIKRVVYSTTREDISWAVAKELFIQADVELVGPETP